MKQILALTICILILSTSKILAQADSNNLVVSILTCSDGKEMYASFGHCAIRVQNKNKGIDYVYNYGMFNYHQQSFYIKFVRGFLNYHVGCSYYNRFCAEYIREGRQVTEQVLNLDYQQQLAMFSFLEWNCLEQNRYYRYNFLEDNCATRIRDIIRNNCGNSVELAKIEYNQSFRDMIHSHLTKMPWFRFGVDLLMGLPVDRKANSETAMFLPEHVFNTLAQSTITHNQKTEPLITQTNTLIKANAIEKNDIFTFISPSLIFWILFAIWGAVTYYQNKKQKYSLWPDRTLFIIVGLFGILLIIMWFFTEHTVTKNNLNILWVLPTHIVAAFNLKSKKIFWKYYFAATAILTFATLILSPILPQQFDIAFYPLMCILILRLAFLAKQINCHHKL